MTAPEVAQRLRAAIEACPKQQSEWASVGETVYELTDYFYRGTRHRINRWSANVQTARQAHELTSDEAARLAAFIAAANPEAIRALLDERDALQAENAELKAACDMSIETTRVLTDFYAEIRAERDALQAKVQEMAGLQRFVGMALQDFPEHGDIDGFTLQDMAVECGLLVEQLVTAPCGETCQCAECGQEGVTMCLRIQPALRSAIDAAIRSSSAPTGEVQ